MTHTWRSSRATSSAVGQRSPAERERCSQQQGNRTSDNGCDRDSSYHGRVRRSSCAQHPQSEGHDATEKPERHSDTKCHRIDVADLPPVHCWQQRTDHTDDPCENRRQAPPTRNCPHWQERRRCRWRFGRWPCMFLGRRASEASGVDRFSRHHCEPPVVGHIVRRRTNRRTGSKVSGTDVRHSPQQPSTRPGQYGGTPGARSDADPPRNTSRGLAVIDSSRLQLLGKGIVPEHVD